MSLLVNSIDFSNKNRRINYKYTISDNVSKYFKKESFFVEYQEDISKIPYEINIIPFLVNVMPIAWFANFRVKVKSVDENFLKALKSLKLEFSKHYNLSNPQDCMLDFEEIIASESYSNSKQAMLFSAGVDAYTTYLRQGSSNLDLITIKGADIKLDDYQQWDDLTNYLDNTAIISKNPKHYIATNLRDFITFEVDKLLPNLGWWGKIQHGMALTGVTAPICYLYNINMLYIASTRSIKMKFSPWGSMPETDNLVSWNTTKVNHDGYELTRLDKVITIIDKTKLEYVKPPLRVCYNEFKSSLNCNTCEKCLRTIFSILIQGKNPKDYGFVVSDNIFQLIYDKLKNGYSTAGTKMYWEEMVEGLELSSLFIIQDSEKERREVIKLINLIKELKNKEIGKISKYTQFRYSVIGKFPKTFTYYLKLRRKFL